MTTEDFDRDREGWLETAKHPRFKVLYTDLIYQPMLELLDYLRANEFKTFIVTGRRPGVRAGLRRQVYGIPPEQVVGSSVVTAYRDVDASPVLVKMPKVFFIDDRPGKPDGINHFIGRRPISAFGNSDGDKEMLEWTAGRDGLRLEGARAIMTDAVREYAYGPPRLQGRHARQGARRGHRQGLDRDRHEDRLEDHLPPGKGSTLNAGAREKENRR